MTYYVYILHCANGKFYVGSTSNLELRLQEHNGEHPIYHRGSDFTFAHRPFKLVYTEQFGTMGEAIKRERQLHKWSHAKKQALIDGDIDGLKTLSKAKSLS